MSLFHDRLRRRRDQHLSRMHEGNSVAAFRLVHEVRGDEDRDVVVAGEIDEDPPEIIARYRVDPRRGLVQDQDIGGMDQRDGKRQALADSEGQTVRQGIQDLLEAQPAGQFGNPFGNPFRGQLEQAPVQFQVLPYRQFVVERKRLAHVSDAAPECDVLAADLLTEQARLALAGDQKPRQHLHGRRLAAAVRAEESEDFAARNLEAHVVDRSEIAKSHAEMAGLDRILFAPEDLSGRDDQGYVTPGDVLRQQCDEGCVEVRRPCPCHEFGRGACADHLAGVHRDDPVEAGSFLHVGCCNQHAEVRAFRPDRGNQFPELLA